ncbi:MAG: hypothetical protein KGL39_44330 [Patescibacteria group bacterium]|nr:hypothetical protein [Patescibacteria group bacterium]
MTEMNSIDMLDALLKLLKKHGFKCRDISTENGKIHVQGLELLPPSVEETAEETSVKRRKDELDKENEKALGFGMRSDL